MSGYNGRRGPNVSQYLANLNTVASPESASEPQKLDDDFSLFMNADFLDSFAGNAADVDLSAPLDFGLDVDQSRRGSQANPASADDSKLDFGLNSDFQFADFSTFNNTIVDPSIQGLPHSQAGAFPSVATTFTSPTSTVSPSVPGFDAAAGKKRKLDLAETIPQQPTDEAARVAAEEDKRRRNTAASARFRIKKKQREQVLEKTAKEMTERVSVLETRIQQLETENTWLKSLITEKNGGKTTTSEIRALLSKHEESSSARSTGARSDGVGTKSEN